MKIEIKTESYNERRYSRPWIAKVTFNNAGKADFSWGDWIGAHGEEGLLVLEFKAGDVIARGQKDNRNARKNSVSYYIIDENKHMREVSKADAFKHYRDHNATSDVSSKEDDIAMLKKQVYAKDKLIRELVEALEFINHAYYLEDEGGWGCEYCQIITGSDDSLVWQNMHHAVDCRLKVTLTKAKEHLGETNEKSKSS